MNRLYLLSFLLTADSTIAEQCFVGGLHIAQEGNHVFKEWAESWARRAIIQNAIRVIRPRRGTNETTAKSNESVGNAPATDREITAIAELPPFERFAFVISVLEHDNDQECSLLLGCTRGEVAAARTRALERMGRSSQLQRDVVGIASNQNTRTGEPRHAAQFRTVSGLAASA